MILLGVTTRAVDDRRRRIILPDAADPALPRIHGNQGLRLALFIVAVVSALALGLTSVSAREHRSRAVTREFQREHPCPFTGKTSGACPGYRKDHVVPLACGGHDAVSNMQWQTVVATKAKDRWEVRACGRYALGMVASDVYGRRAGLDRRYRCAGGALGRRQVRAPRPHCGQVSAHRFQPDRDGLHLAV